VSGSGVVDYSWGDAAFALSAGARLPVAPSADAQAQRIDCTASPKPAKEVATTRAVRPAGPTTNDLMKNAMIEP
jgi:hypothetical protein